MPPLMPPSQPAWKEPKQETAPDSTSGEPENKE
jgi:hypothetical protein